MSSKLFYICETKTKKDIMQQVSEKDKLYKVIRYAIVMLLVVFVILPFLVGFVSGFLSN